MPLVANKVAVRFVVLTLPALRRRRIAVTVSPLSTAPLGGWTLSTVKVTPAPAMLTKGAATRVVTVAVLFTRLGSVWVPEMLAVKAIVPAAGGRTCSTIRAVAPLANVPMSAVTVLPPTEIVPRLV